MTVTDRHILTEHLAFIERMTANSKRSNGWTFDEEIPALRRILEEENSRAPVPELAGTFPVTVYFSNDDDREEFIVLMQQAKPGLVARKL